MKLSKLSESVGQGASLQKDLFAAKANTPNAHDATVEFVESLREPVKDQKHGWAGGANAFLNGLASSARVASLQDRQQDLASYEKVMNWMANMNQQAVQRNAVYENRVQAQQLLMPQVQAYMQQATQMDPISRRTMAQQIMDGWNRSTGETGQVVSIDGTDPFLLTLQTQQGPSVVDLRTLFAGNDVMQRDLAMQMPAFLEQQRYDRGRDAAQLGMQEQRLRMDQNELDWKQSKTERNPQEEKHLWKQLEQATVAERELQLYNDAERLLQSDEAVMNPGGQVIQSIPYLGAGWRKNAAQEQLETIGSELRGLEFKRSGYRAQAEFNKIKTVDPKSSREGNLKIIEQKKKELTSWIQKKAALEQQLGLQGQSMGQQQTPITPQEQPVVPEGQAGKVQMQAPDGSKRWVDSSQVEYWTRKGAVVS